MKPRRPQAAEKASITQVGQAWCYFVRAPQGREYCKKARGNAIYGQLDGTFKNGLKELKLGMYRSHRITLFVLINFRFH